MSNSQKSLTSCSMCNRAGGGLYFGMTGKYAADLCSSGPVCLVPTGPENEEGTGG